MSLQTGTRLARASKPIIDPATLKVIAYELEGPLLSNKSSILVTDDIREFGSLGIIINSSDDFVELGDVIKIEKTHELGFKLIGMQVIDERKHKLGKVEDYTLDSKSFVIQQLRVNRGILRGLTETNLTIHRSQIVKIDNQKIVVKTTAKRLVEPIKQAVDREYVNPFRNPAPQTEQ